MKLCTRCGLPLPDGYSGGRHYDPDECVRLLLAERDRERYARLTLMIEAEDDPKRSKQLMRERDRHE